MPPKAKPRSDSVGKAKSKARADSSGPARAKGKAKAKAKSAAAPKAAAAAEAAPSADAPAEAEASAPAAGGGEAAAPPEVPAAPEADALAAEAPAAESPAAPAAPPPNPAPEERARRLVEEVPDPWASLAEDCAYAKVADEAWDAVAEGLDAECPSGAHVIAKDAGLHDASSASDALAGAAVSLDFSENSLERIDAMPALWLRHLNVSSNPLASLQGLSVLFPRLLAIDLSFVDLPSIDGAWAALAACAGLRSLVAESAGMSSFEDMPMLPTLQNLELVENDVEDVAEVETLAQRCPGLRRLDLRENPLVTEPFYIKAVAQHLPGLVWHNNQSTKKYTAQAAGRGRAHVNFDAEVNAVDGLYKNEGCSCIEGNPCLDPTTCIDWEHREAVAAEARRRKGLRGPAGELM